LCRSGRSLSEWVAERMRAFPCSGEINFRLADSNAKIQKILETYAQQQPRLDYTDGISVEFSDWRFNLRCSNTEPLLRLNVETRGDPVLMKLQTEKLCALISS